MVMSLGVVDETALSIREGVNAMAEAAHANSVSKGFWDTERIAPPPDTLDRMVAESGSENVAALVRVVRDLQAALDRRSFNFGEKIALTHSELSEALEKHRKTLGKGNADAPDEHCPEFGGIAIELADAIIRIGDLAGRLKIDLGGAVVAKMAYNKTRQVRHGKAY